MAVCSPSGQSVVVGSFDRLVSEADKVGEKTSEGFHATSYPGYFASTVEIRRKWLIL